MSNIKLENIKDVFKNKLVIPSYQRGYRWTCENGEVQALLEDIKEFKEIKEAENKIRLLLKSCGCKKNRR